MTTTSRVTLRMALIKSYHFNQLGGPRAPHNLKGETMDKEQKRVLYIGEIGVDSGQILMTDPCYVLQEDDYHKDIRAKLWKKATTDLDEKNIRMSGLGTIVRTGGDGGFPAYAELNDAGEIVNIIIKLKG